MFDPLTIGLAIKAMQTAYLGIQYCCEALADGKVQVQKIKKAAEDAQAIVKEVKGFWSLITGLFIRSKDPAGEKKAVSVKAAEKKQPEIYIRHIPTEAEIVQKFVDHVGDFYHHHRELSDLYDTKSEEVFLMDRPDPRDILLLSQIKNELDGTFVKVSGLMRGTGVPPQLGPLWDNFNSLYERATLQQQDRRDRERVRKQYESWQRREAHNDRVELGIGLFLTLILTTWVWGLWISLFIAA